MKYLAAYFLAVLGGNETPSAADVSKILEAGEIEVDADEVARLLAAVEGKVRRAPPPRAHPLPLLFPQVRSAAHPQARPSLTHTNTF
jgi:hypothetical protein